MLTGLGKWCNQDEMNEFQRKCKQATRAVIPSHSKVIWGEGTFSCAKYLDPIRRLGASSSMNTQRSEENSEPSTGSTGDWFKAEGQPEETAELSLASSKMVTTTA